jgi:hypothetical protein
MIPPDNVTFVPGSTNRFVTHLLTPQEEMHALMSWEDPIQEDPGDATLLDSTEAEFVSLWSLLLPPKLILVHSNRECLSHFKRRAAPTVSTGHSLAQWPVKKRLPPPKNLAGNQVESVADLV